MTSALKYGLLTLWLIFPFAFIAALTANKYYRSEESANTVLRLKSWFFILAVFTSLFILPVPAACFLLFCILCLAFKEVYRAAKKHFSGFVYYIFFILFLCIFCGGCLFFFKGGKELFFFVTVCVQLNDIFQYLWGKSTGKTPLAVKISPNKTLEGFLGGMFTTALLSFFTAPYFTGLKGIYAFAAGIILACLGLSGDLTVSALKRKLNIKDMGNILAGHGGITDRADSLLYITPLALAYLYFNLP